LDAEFGSKGSVPNLGNMAWFHVGSLVTKFGPKTESNHWDLRLTLLDPASEISGLPGWWIPPPLWKTHFFYTGNNTYIRSSDPKGSFPYFKLCICWLIKFHPKIQFTLQNFENQKFIKEKSAADFFGGPPKVNRGT
jgi:hypothetical protein